MARMLRTAALAAGMALCASVAAAHGAMKQTTPADGATIAQMPEIITVRFDEPHRVTLLRIVDDHGGAIRLETVEGMAPAEAVTAPCPTLEPGAYKLEWRALSADGHAVGGASGFTYAPGG